MRNQEVTWKLTYTTVGNHGRFGTIYRSPDLCLSAFMKMRDEGVNSTGQKVRSLEVSRVVEEVLLRKEL